MTHEDDAAANNSGNRMMTNIVPDIEDLHKNMKLCAYYETFWNKAD